MRLRSAATRAKNIKGEIPQDENLKYEKEASPSLQQQQDRSCSSLENDVVKRRLPDIKRERIEEDTVNKQQLFEPVDEDMLSPMEESDGDDEEYGVKQEETAKNQALATAIDSNGKSFFYQCYLCKTAFRNSRAVIKHRRSVHGIRKSRLAIKYLSLEPDVFDANNYCRSCETSYTSRGNYRKHLQKVHHIFMKKRQERRLLVSPDPEDPDLRCRSCKTSYKDLTAFRSHLLRLHGIRAPKRSLTSIKHPDIVPDWNDPSFYCPSCERQYKNKHIFQSHCRHVHKLKNPNTLSMLERELPDLYDPNFHCNLCNITHATERKFRSHCYKVHGMRMTFTDMDVKEPNILNQCSMCIEKFCSNERLNRHLFVTHKMDDYSSVPPPASLVLPDINDPNYYCRVCDKTFKAKSYFKYHLLAVHALGEQQTPETEALQPDINDPNHYCRVCQKSYGVKNNYRAHIRFTHQILIRRTTAYDPNEAPDPLDPNFYCRVCKTSYEELVKYRRHCRQVHRMKLIPIPKLRQNPDAEIDVYDPNFYCAKCNKNMKNPTQFRFHLRKRHRIKPPRRDIINPNAPVDKDDPNLYCTRCEKDFFCRRNFLNHLSSIHKIT